MSRMYICSSMHESPDILRFAYKQPVLQEELQIMVEKEQQILGSIQYSIRRYRKFPQWNVEDTGMLVYHFEKTSPSNNYLELKFCVTGNVYCWEKSTECDNCKLNSSRHC